MGIRLRALKKKRSRSLLPTISPSIQLVSAAFYCTIIEMLRYDQIALCHPPSLPLVNQTAAMFPCLHFYYLDIVPM